jgi:diguanylate cyclase (GGDEF)-like protein
MQASASASEEHVSLRSKILATMALPLIVLVIATFALLTSRRQTTEALTAERNAVAIRDTLDHVLVDLTDAETGSRGYLLTGEESFLEPYTNGTDALTRDMHALNALIVGDPIATAEVAKLQVLANQRLSLLQTTQLLAPVTDLTNHAQLISQMSRGKAVADDIRDVVSQAQDEAADLLAVRQRSLDRSRTVSFMIGIVGMPLGMLASLIVVALSTGRLVNRIRRTEQLARMLEEGLPLGDASTSDDELGRLERVLVRSGDRVVELQGELRHMATADPLTRLINRRGFLPTAEHQLEVAKRNHQPLALVFLDLDGLKKVNDSLGHSAGDGMIAEAAFVMRDTFRASDLIARMGGDEFCILFATESEDAAEATIARLHFAAEVTNRQEGRPFALAFSTGIAVFDPEEPQTLDQLMAVADERMYCAKRAKATTTSLDEAPVI